ncbi:PAS domain S-box-containing protein/diguanylate cyclase (GGDEF) domain-containing protein [Andreprevotia lacus DSM 23236]|jgi:diguanylate cyclase (GGDEF)-like protein/PAS domain S-box-containing protein|uniref:diguanylate cyclase n=1 Tax=Andreprevotia lacus DSM 23236 TaxID=1121001 RepID=A0A1W1XP32_9NEIS|nr:diguanylate cyclase [Andreprevotia lacus]SMC25750.1 PAS domain S-box-containing protein/diguanylate cyclase (GGDEF) domain-containing protein [Andreprevotia lacus DSM 23236]
MNLPGIDLNMDAAALGQLLPYAAWVKDIHLRYRWVNRHWADMLDLPVRQIIGRSDAECMPPWLAEPMGRADCTTLARGEPYGNEVMVQLQDGRQRLWRMQRQAVLDTEGNLDGVAGFVIDATDDWRARRELKKLTLQSSGWWQSLKSHALVATLTPQGRYSYVSEHFCRLVGCPASGLLGENHATLGWIAVGVDFHHVLAMASQGNPVRFEFAGTRSNGQRFWAQSLVISLGTPVGDEPQFFEIVSDLGEVREVTQKLSAANAQLTAALNENVELIARLDHLARTDPLTHLLNRRSFLERAAQEQARSARLQQPLSVLALDIDHFKQVNDAFGHAAGDQVLERLAEVCRETCRIIDIVARMGGEEFSILLPGTGPEQAQVLAERLRLALAQQTVVLPDQQRISFTISIGVTGWGAHELLQPVLERADQALYQAKSGGRNRVISL